MAEVLVQFDDRVVDAEGKAWVARVCGREAENGHWEGWLEFALDDGQAVRTGQETTQPSRRDLAYWGTGLSKTFLDGALRRALAGPPKPRPAVRHVEAQPAYDGPAPNVRSWSSGEGTRATLDPFQVFAQGEGVLRGELSALSAWRLVNILKAYELHDGDPEELQRLSAPELADRIVAAVRRHADHPRTRSRGDRRDEQSPEIR